MTGIRAEKTEKATADTSWMTTSQAAEVRRLSANQLDKLIKKHKELPPNTKEEFRYTYDANQILDLCDTMTEVLKKEKSLVRMNFVDESGANEEIEEIVVVGDIHGQFYDLMRMFAKFRGHQKNDQKWMGEMRHKFMFLGDYVDRGFNSLECIVYLFALKCRFPQNYQLLRGNHESSAVNLEYGFRRELIDRYDNLVGKELWEKFNETFKYLPLAGLIGKRVLCMHGGISSHLHSLTDIEDIQRPIDDPLSHQLVRDLLWADPSPAVEEYGSNTMRGSDIEVFGIRAVENTCKRLNVKMILRAHQVVPNGYLLFCNQLLTIFSAPRYENGDNKAAVAVISRKGFLKILPLTPSNNQRNKGSTSTTQSSTPRRKSSESSTTRRRSSESSTTRRRSSESSTTTTTSKTRSQKKKF